MRNNLGDEDLPAYSVLQLEAKKFKYCFNSWGGDRVNDWPLSKELIWLEGLKFPMGVVHIVNLEPFPGK